MGRAGDEPGVYATGKGRMPIICGLLVCAKRKQITSWGNLKKDPHSEWLAISVIRDNEGIQSSLFLHCTTYFRNPPKPCFCGRQELCPLWPVGWFAGMACDAVEKDEILGNLLVLTCGECSLSLMIGRFRVFVANLILCGNIIYGRNNSSWNKVC